MKRRDAQRGTALLFALVVVAILGTGTTVLWSQLHTHLQQHRATWHREQAHHLAEAGLETALDKLRHSGEEALENPSTFAMDSGSAAVSISDGQEADSYILKSTGRLENAAYIYDTVTLEATVSLGPEKRVRSYAVRPLKKGEGR